MAAKEAAVLWLTYVFFSLSALSAALMMGAFLGVFANRALSCGVFNASATMATVYTALSLVTGHLVG